MLASVMDRTLGGLLGWAVPPVALTHDLHDEYGWPEQAEKVARVVSTLSPEERDSAVILTGNYGEAAAASFFGNGYDLPPAVSGHMNYYLWGPSSRRADVAIAYGLPRAILASLYADVKVAGRIEHPLAHPFERDLPIYVCRAPIRPLREGWPELKRYSNSGRPLTTDTE